MNDIKTILATLISYESITPNDAGCQDYMIDFFSRHGFECQRFDKGPVRNFFAHIGTKAPLLVFAGHTDVVPAGDLSQWNTPPFTLHEQNALLYGRGSADMKGSLAAMMVMAAKLVTSKAKFNGSLGFLITSGEEGDDFELGTPYVMQELNKLGIHPDYCIVGEPSSKTKVGDMIRIGRRGSLTGRLTLEGKQGHVAYPHLADNPIHKFAAVLADFTTIKWDEGNDHFPPTSMQITHLKSGGEAGNIIPGKLFMQFNFRYSTEQTVESLQQAVKDCFKKHHLTPIIDWQLNGNPFLTSKGELLESSLKAIKEITGLTTECSTGGGTSDGRFIAPYNVEVIELGPVNATIHQVNECVSLSDLNALGEIYYSICQHLIIQN